MMKKTNMNKREMLEKAISSIRHSSHTLAESSSINRASFTNDVEAEELNEDSICLEYALKVLESKLKTLSNPKVTFNR